MSQPPSPNPQAVYLVSYSYWAAQGPNGLCCICSTPERAADAVRLIRGLYPKHSEDGFIVTPEQLDTFTHKAGVVWNIGFPLPPARAT